MYKMSKKIITILLVASTLVCCSFSKEATLSEVYFSDSSDELSKAMEEYLESNKINYYEEGLTNVTPSEIADKCSIYACGHLYNIIECNKQINYGLTERISQMFYYKSSEKELLYYIDWYPNSALTMWWFRTMALDFKDGKIKMVDCKTAMPYRNAGHDKIIKFEAADEQLKLYEYGIDLEDKKYGLQIEEYSQTRLELLEDNILEYDLLIDWNN